MKRRLALAASLCAPAQADPQRSRVLRAEFQRLSHCPATGATRGPCVGFEVDHAVPLCLGGQRVDTISNLRWMSVEEHRRKTREDVRLCRQAGAIAHVELNRTTGTFNHINDGSRIWTP